MTRVQSLFFSAVLALMMAMHATAELFEMSPGDSNWLSMVGVGVSALIGAAALGLFLRTWRTPADGQPFLSAKPKSRRRSIWPAIGGVILCLVGTFLALVLARSMGIGSARISQSLETAAAMMFPVVGSFALFWLLRNAPAKA